MRILIEVEVDEESTDEAHDLGLTEEAYTELYSSGTIPGEVVEVTRKR